VAAVARRVTGTMVPSADGPGGSDASREARECP